MHDIYEKKNLYEQLSSLDIYDEFNTLWINNRSINIYNELIVYSQPINFVVGERGYAVFNNFLYKSRIIPYTLRISNGISKDNIFEVKFSPKIMIPSVYIKVKSSDIPYNAKYYNMLNIENFTYIFADDINIIMLAVIDIYKHKHINFDILDERDYESSISDYLYGDLDISVYFSASGWDQI